MANTFVTAYTRLLDMVNRPASETAVLAAAKAAINDAILFLQRNHAYAYTEANGSFTVAANTLSSSLASILTSIVVRDIISVQQVSAAGIFQGKPVKIMTYSQLQAQRSKYERSHSSIEPYVLDESLQGWTIEDAYQSDRVAFMAGQTLGIYPTPTAATYWYLNYHAWLPPLSGDTDTNFFLDYAYDVVTMLAMKTMHIYMKEDARFSVTEQQCADAIAGLVAWDSQLRENSNTSIS